MGSQIIIDEVGKRLSPEDIKAKVARTLIATLTNKCREYCILSGYEQLPESFDTDIDFMVDEDDFLRMPQIIEQVAHETNTRLFHTVGHELTARSYSLGFQAGDKLIIVQPDSTADYRHFGLLWLRSREVLTKRRWHSRGFWIPAAHHEFTYYLLKRLNKRSLTADHGLKLHQLYIQDPLRCDEMIERFWMGRNREAIRRMALTNDWTEMELSLEIIRSEMLRHSGESLAQRIASAPTHIIHHARRIAFPTGGWIAVMGPDGAGKSAVIEAIREQFRFAYHKVKCFHLRPKSLLPGKQTHEAVTNPHGRPPRGMLLSIAKVFFLIADYWLGYALQIAPAMRRSQLIIFDRYIHDLLVDSKRIRYGGPAWLLRLAARVVPHPDLVILLDAPPDVLWSRKQEVPYNEVMRQRDGYVRIARHLPFAVVVNAAQALPDVIADIDQAIVNYFERRTAERLHLKTRTAQANHSSIQAPGQQC